MKTVARDDAHDDRLAGHGRLGAVEVVLVVEDPVVVAVARLHDGEGHRRADAGAAVGAALRGLGGVGPGRDRRGRRHRPRGAAARRAERRDSAPEVSAPLKMRTVTVGSSPGPLPAVPVSVGKRLRDVKPGPGPVIASAGPMACEPRTHVAADSLLVRSASAKTALSRMLSFWSRIDRIDACALPASRPSWRAAARSRRRTACRRALGADSAGPVEWTVSGAPVGVEREVVLEAGDRRSPTRPRSRRRARR